MGRCEGKKSEAGAVGLKEQSPSGWLLSLARALSSVVRQIGNPPYIFVLGGEADWQSATFSSFRVPPMGAQ